MVGSRFAEKGIVYPVSEAAARYGASIEAETPRLGRPMPGGRFLRRLGDSGLRHRLPAGGVLRPAGLETGDFRTP